SLHPTATLGTRGHNYAPFNKRLSSSTENLLLELKCRSMEAGEDVFDNLSCYSERVLYAVQAYQKGYIKMMENVVLLDWDLLMFDVI
ncbi:hypothetical protein AVEN_250038-1, partial [Araneus ventricosus]